MAKKMKMSTDAWLAFFPLKTQSRSKQLKCKTVKKFVCHSHIKENTQNENDCNIN
jgi:hypothetical protein